MNPFDEQDKINKSEGSRKLFRRMARPATVRLPWETEEDYPCLENDEIPEPLDYSDCAFAGKGARYGNRVAEGKRTEEEKAAGVPSGATQGTEEIGGGNPLQDKEDLGSSELDSSSGLEASDTGGGHEVASESGEVGADPE